MSRVTFRGTSFGLVLALVSAIPAHGQAQSMLQVAYDSVSARFGHYDWLLIPIDQDDDLLEYQWGDSVSAVPAHELRTGLSQATRSFDHVFDCNERRTCLFRGEVKGTVAFGELRRTDDSVTLGVVVRYAAGGDAIAPALAWFEVHVYRRDDRTLATVRLVGNT